MSDNRLETILETGDGSATGAKVVLQQLERILNSDEFANARRNRQLLRHLVVETLEGRASDLRGYQIGVAVFDKGSDFDPQLDPIVRTQAHRLRHALDRYSIKEGLSDPIRIDIPKGQYVPSFSRVLNSDTSGRVAGFGPEDIARRRGLPAIAVFPFSILSGSEEWGFVSLGLAEELVHAFSVFPDLRVAASYSTQAGLDEKMPPREVGRLHGVDYIIHGTLRQSKEIVRITVELLDTLDGTNLLSERYEYKLSASNVFDVQDDIVRRVVAKIADDYGVISRTFQLPENRQRTDQITAYQAVLNFQKYNCEPTRTTYKTSKAALEQAVETDPGYARAWALLAEMCCDNFGLQFEEDPETLDRAADFAERAINLDAVCQHAHMVRAYAHFLKREHNEFLQAIEKAISLNPNAAYNSGFGGFLIAMSGDWERGLHILREAEALNPYHPPFFAIALCLDAYQRRDWESALGEARRIGVLRFPWTHLLSAAVLCKLDRMEEASEALRRLSDIRPEFVQDLSKARNYLQAYIYDASLVDDLVQDLESSLNQSSISIQSVV